MMIIINSNIIIYVFTLMKCKNIDDNIIIYVFTMMKCKNIDDNITINNYNNNDNNNTFFICFYVSILQIIVSISTIEIKTIKKFRPMRRCVPCSNFK